MTEQTPHHPLAESLSALMDDQASELELQRLLKASESDTELRATWARYQLASAALRGDLPSVAGIGFAERLSAALADEPSYSSPAATSESARNKAERTGLNWWQNAGRFAVAASVAGAVIIGVQQFDGGAAPMATPAVAVDAEAVEFSPAVSLPAGYGAPALSARTVSAQSGYEPRQLQQDSRQVIFVPHQSGQPALSAEQVRDYLNQLIEEHAEHAALNGGQGMLPFARVVMAEEDATSALEQTQEQPQEQPSAQPQ